VSAAPPDVLADAAARHTIEYRLDCTLFVEAGAGSGKTTALVARIVQMLRSGACSLDSLAAITFTEAAALELKVKVRESLTALAEHARPGAERDRVVEALDNLDDAAISTIHGFCRKLLADHPIEAGLPPHIEILDEVRQSLAWRRQWSLLLDRLGEDEGMRAMFGAAALVGVTPAHLELLAKEVGDEWHGCGRAAPDTGRVLDAVAAAVEGGTEAVVSSIGRALELASCCTDSDDWLLARLMLARDLRAQLLTAGGAGVEGIVADRLALLAARDPYLRASNVGQRPSWTCDIEDVRLCLAEAQDARDGVVAEVCNAVLPAIVATFDVAAREAAEARRAEGKLVFHDLLVLARDLLAGNPVVLADVRRRVKFLLIDEFQDTDPLQLEIAEQIASSGAAGRIGAPETGRLFLVGDPKQSIYRFRGADAEVYAAARQRLAPSGAVSLTSNFRSVPGILEFANECFAAMMGEGYSSLDPVRSAVAAGPAVHVVGGPLDAKLRRHDQRVAESEACAATIDQAVRTGPWLVGDGAGGSRPARMNDVAILVPRRTGLDELETALDAAAIGFRLESASLIYRTQEVRDLLALCKAIDDPGDRVALLATLRSPAFACRDDELFAFRAAGGAWSVEDPGELGAGDDVVAQALAVLRGYRCRRFELGPVEILELAVRDRKLLQLAAGSPRERESWRRVRFLIERARAFVDAGGGGLREFAASIDEQLSEGLRPVESVLPEPDEDVVHILTVHAAKGLEFPITVLASFGTTDEIRNVPSRRVLRPPTGGVEVRLRKSLETAGFAGLEVAEDELERQEAVRVLYVAATRARDHLVVCGHHVPASSGSGGTLGQRLFEAATAALARRPGPWEAVEFLEDSYGGLVGLSRAVPPVDADGIGHHVSQGSLFDLAAIGTAADVIVAHRAGRPPAASPDDWRAWRQERDELLARIARPRSVRATELALLAEPGDVGTAGRHLGSGDPGDADWLASSGERHEYAGDAGRLMSPGGGTNVRRHGRTQLGRAVHATLRDIDIHLARAVAGGTPAGDGLRRLAEFQASAEGITGLAGDVERLVAAALSSPTVREAFATPNPHREVFVATTVDGVVLDGYVDLCFEHDDGLTVVDYKTDTVRDLGEIEAAAEHHCLQAAAYALALGEATNLPVHRCVLVFVSAPGRPIDFEVPHLGQTIERVRTLVVGAK
jgi:ATP-dependent helicase/nuclease subunit A